MAVNSKKPNYFIHFFSEDIRFTLKNKNKIRQWLSAVALKEKSSIAELNYIFCSDKYLLALNKKHLKHDTFTDIITFESSGSKLKTQNSKLKTSVAGDIFISIERVKENAKEFKVSFEQELHRVMIHGLLHLLGYKDKTPSDKKEIRKKEDDYLAIF